MRLHALAHARDPGLGPPSGVSKLGYEQAEVQQADVVRERVVRRYPAAVTLDVARYVPAVGEQAGEEAREDLVAELIGVRDEVVGPEPVDGTDRHVHRARPVDAVTRRVRPDPVVDLGDHLARVACVAGGSVRHPERGEMLTPGQLPRHLDVGAPLGDRHLPVEGRRIPPVAAQNVFVPGKGCRSGALARCRPRREIDPVDAEEAHHAAGDEIRVGERALPPGRYGPLELAYHSASVSGIEEETRPFGRSEGRHERVEVVLWRERAPEHLLVRARWSQRVAIARNGHAGAAREDPKCVWGARCNQCSRGAGGGITAITSARGCTAPAASW